MSVLRFIAESKWLLTAIVVSAAAIAVAIITRPPRYKALWRASESRHYVLDTHTGRVYPDGVK